MSETITRHFSKLTPGVDYDVEEEIEIDDGSNEDFSGWFCIATDPWPCPFCKQNGEIFFVEFATMNHKIIVFPEKDDPKLLSLAQVCQEVGRNPRIVEYEIGFGPCISYYAFEYITHS